MKKIRIAAAALALAAGLSACGTAAPASSQPVASATAQPAPEVPETTPGPTVPPAPVPTAAPEPVAVDYENTDFMEWTFTPESADGVVEILTQIDSVPYGTAGSSLSMASAAVQLLELTGQERVLEKTEVYLKDMTDLQRDYFSFQWQMVSASAEGILSDYENWVPMLSDIGREDFDPEQYSLQTLLGLRQEVETLLENLGVTQQWRSHTDMEPFFNAEPDRP